MMIELTFADIKCPKCGCLVLIRVERGRLRCGCCGYEFTYSGIRG